MTIIRPATEADIESLYRIAEDMQAKHEHRYFERCLTEQQDEKRQVVVAEEGGRLVGYVQLVWEPMYTTFRRLGIPEIQDLNVIPDMRGRGIGGQLVDAAEALVRAKNKPEIGISVGLFPSFGPAQRLYVKKGYIPDGTGACYDDIPVRPGEMWSTLISGPTALETLFTIKLVKTL
jgi:GNAT superfamily N-acetyltransferase